MCPTYNFFCSNTECEYEKEFYLNHFIRDNERPQTCPECGGKMENEIFSPAHIKFCEKGSYIQDTGFNNESPEYNFRRKQKLERKNKKDEI